MKIKKFKLGSDPELFLRRKDTGEYFPAIGIIQGTKKKPIQMQGLPKGFTWQVDGMALEFNTIPSNNKQEWLENHKTALRYIKQNINNEEFDICAHPIAEFNPEYFKMPGARELGCSVDYNAWLSDQNPKPDADVDWRCAAFHIHIGAEELSETLLIEELIKTLDLFLGVPSILIDSERQRRQLYGKAGCFRFAHGFIGTEYRVLSNHFLSSDELISWVYENTEKAIQFINDGKTIEKEDEIKIQTTINLYQEDKAKELVNKYQIGLPEKTLVLV